jgi:hypothetical protein
MEIERGVTEWGMPMLQWDDLQGTMTGNPFTDNMPKIETKRVTRRLWIAYDGIDVCAMDDWRPSVAGHWDEWKSVELGSTRDDLTPQELANLERRRLRWVEHQTLTAYFSDGTINRIVQSAVSRNEMTALHDAITRTFIVERPRGRYLPPQSGRALRGFEMVSPTEEDLIAGEVSGCVWNASSQVGPLKAGKHQGIPSVYWLEPITSRGGWFAGTKHHLVKRLLYVGKGDGPDRRFLAYGTYRNDGKSLMVHMPFDMLQAFEIIESPLEKFPFLLKNYFPIPNTLPSRTIVAQFRYGHVVPLTLGGGELVEGLRNNLEQIFLPLVGKRLSDADIGVESASSTSAERVDTPKSKSRGVPTKL